MKLMKLELIHHVELLTLGLEVQELRSRNDSKVNYNRNIKNVVLFVKKSFTFNNFVINLITSANMFLSHYLSPRM